MQLVVVRLQTGNGELIGDLHRHGARLSKAQVMRLRGPAAADQTRLASNKCEMRRISDPLLFGNEVGARRRRAGRSEGVCRTVGCGSAAVGRLAVRVPLRPPRVDVLWVSPGSAPILSLPKAAELRDQKA